MKDAALLEQFSIGFGCSPRADIADIIRLVKASIDPIVPDTVLATIDRRAAIAESVASALGLRLIVFPGSVLKEVAGVTTQSSLALARIGTSSVAEASALASLGPSARLVVPQQKGRLCTCAIAALQTGVQL